MDDDLHALEAELKRLQPARPSARLRARVGESLTRPQRVTATPWRWLAGIAMPAAAMVAVLALWPEKNLPPRAAAAANTAGATPSALPASSPESADTLKPIVVENVLYAAHDEVLGREVHHVDLPVDAFEGSLAQAGLPPWFANLLADVYGTLFASGGAERLTDAVERITGTKPRSLREFAIAHEIAFRAAA